MNNEIKAFLVNIKGNEEYKEIYEYITNLQEENEILKRDYATMVHDNCYVLELEQKIDKAIEYITSEQSIETFKTIESREEWLKINHKLLNILQGDKGE